MAVIGAETLAVVGEPDVDDMVLGAGEEEVAFAIELDLGEGSLVACVWRVEMRKVGEEMADLGGELASGEDISCCSGQGGRDAPF